MRKESGTIVYSPSDLIRYLVSPFGLWLHRYDLENPGAIRPDQESGEEIVFPCRPRARVRELHSFVIQRESGSDHSCSVIFPRLSSALSARVSFDMQSRGVPTPRRRGAKKRCVKLRIPL